MAKGIVRNRTDRPPHQHGKDNFNESEKRGHSWHGGISLSHVRRDVSKKDFGRKKTRFIRQTKEYYARHLADTDQFSVCAKQKGVTIGCGTILFQKRPPVIFRAGNVTGYILNINIQPEFRRKRLATRIMRTLHTEAQRRGVYRIGLHASKAGIKLYVKLGYRQKKNYFERMM